eukprot:scaffold511_cov62-Cyclotella_meneghiniana.AAC.2
MDGLAKNGVYSYFGELSERAVARFHWDMTMIKMYEAVAACYINPDAEDRRKNYFHWQNNGGNAVRLAQ